MLTRPQISAFLGLSVAFWAIMLFLQGLPLTIAMFAPFGAVVGALSFTLLLFDKWAWKWPIFRGWLVKRPDIDGVWKGEIQSDWIDPETGKGIPTIDCFVVVRQTASKLSIRLLTKESRSETVSSGIEVCGDDTFEITCAYRNKPKSMYRYRSEVHYGAMLLPADTARPKRLEGEYWTDRKTTGQMVLTDRRSGKPMTFDEASDLYTLGTVKEARQ